MSDYRRTALRCPGCNAFFEEQASDDLVLDVCPDCGGLFVEWLDGEVRAVVRKVGEGIPPPAKDGGDAAGGSGACPQCAVPMHDESVGASPATVRRCGGCAAVFVPAKAIEELRQAASRADAAPEGDPFLTRLLDAIGRSLGLRS